MVIAISNINAQHNNSSLRDDVCYKHESLDIGYYIKLNGKLYSNWETAYICESDLVANIEILYNESEERVQGSDWDWSGCTGQNSGDATITIGDFNNIDKKSTMKVQFIEEKYDHPNITQTINLTLYVYLITNVTINDKATHAIAQYAYDENGHWQMDNLKSSVSNDYYNLMNSGNIYNNGTTHVLSEYKLRRYQWRKIYLKL